MLRNSFVSQVAAQRCARFVNVGDMTSIRGSFSCVLTEREVERGHQQPGGGGSGPMPPSTTASIVRCTSARLSDSSRSRGIVATAPGPFPGVTATSLG